MKSLVDLLDEYGTDLPDPSDPLVSALVEEILILAEEVCVARDRLRARRPAASSEDEAEVRLADHAAFYGEIFGRLSRALDRNASFETREAAS